MAPSYAYHVQRVRRYGKVVLASALAALAGTPPKKEPHRPHRLRFDKETRTERRARERAEAKHKRKQERLYAKISERLAEERGG